jgi:hypothetical protein
MYYSVIKFVVAEHLGWDIGCLLVSFIMVEPKPWCWPIAPQPSPWDPLVEVSPDDGIMLPLFAP